MAEIDDVVAELLAKTGTPGCSLGVASNAGDRVTAYGHAHADLSPAFLPETRVPVASMTKPFTATAVLALVESGRVDLDAPVRRYLPEFRVADADASEQVRVRHLLTHAVGWSGDVPDRTEFRGEDALARHVARLAEAPQVLPPGERFSYANTGLDVAGRLVEVLCGVPYEDAVDRLVLRPLGLGASTFFADQVVGLPAAAGHHVDETGVATPVRDAWQLARSANPSGGLVSTAGDQLRWLRWWLGDDDTPLHPTTRALALRDPVPVTPHASTALGWHVEHVDGADVVYHEGNLAGVATIAMFVPAAALACTVLTNAGDGHRVYRPVCDHLLAELAGVHRPAPGDVHDADAAVLAEYAGSYAAPAPGGEQRVQLTAAAGTLTADVHLWGPPLDPPAMTVGQRDGDAFAIVDGPWRDHPVDFLRTQDGQLLGLRIVGRVLLRIT